MSVNHTTFLVYGVRLDNHEFTDEQLEEYDPPTRKDRFNFDQVAVIIDGMNGSYKIAGFIYKQSDPNEALEDVISIPELPVDQCRDMDRKLQLALGLKDKPTLGWLIVPHYY